MIDRLQLFRDSITRVFDFSSYLDDKREPKYIQHGYIANSPNHSAPQFYYGYGSLSIRNIYCDRYTEIHASHVIGSTEIIIDFDESSYDIDFNDFNDDIDYDDESLVGTVKIHLCTEEEYFQTSTVEKPIVSFEQTQYINKFINDVAEYAQEQKSKYYNEYLGQIDK